MTLTEHTARQESSSEVLCQPHSIVLWDLIYSSLCSSLWMCAICKKKQSLLSVLPAFESFPSVAIFSLLKTDLFDKVYFVARHTYQLSSTPGFGVWGLGFGVWGL